MHARLQVLELLRLPGFSVATLGFPTVFFLLFGLPNARARPDVFLASYAGFAVLGVGFFQFGVSIALERVTPWQLWLRTLPASAFSRMAGRVLAALAFASASAALVIATVLATTSTTPRAGEMARLAGTLLLGSVPFVALGLVIAYWSSPKAALPVANLLYIVLAYVGGFWSGPTDLPHWLDGASPYTPTRQWGDLLWSAVSGGGFERGHWLALAGYTALFGALAAWGYRRDEG
ncbi:MAG: ABC transporter permease, partial [Gaiellaceae bacterium]